MRGKGEREVSEEERGGWEVGEEEGGGWKAACTHHFLVLHGPGAVG